MYVSLFIFAYTSYLVVSMYCAYYSFVYVQPTVLAAPQEPLFGIRFVLREIIVTKNRHPCIVRNAFSQIFAAGWGKYVTKLCTHVYTFSELLSHIWSELGSLCWIRPSFGDGTTRSNQIFHLLHIYACWKGFLKDKHRQFCKIFLGCFLRYKK